MLNLVGKSMYSDDFSKINLKDEDVRKAFKYVYDMKVNGYTQSPLYPMGGNGNSEFPPGALRYKQLRFVFGFNIC